MPIRAKAFVAFMLTLGVALLCFGLMQWQFTDAGRFLAYVLVAVMASGLKVVLPGINGTMSVGFLFVLIGTLDMSLSETLVVGLAATLFQSFWRARHQANAVHLAFNISDISIAITASYLTYHHLGNWLHVSSPLLLSISATVYFLTNTVPIATVVSLAEHKNFRKLWAECYFWSFPYYMVGAAIAVLVHYLNRFIGWEASLLALPVVYGIYRSYRLYLGRLEDEKRHVEAMASLHLRTIEALALAIEAKDHITHDHLQRVRCYAVEIGKEMGLSPEQLEAMRAAALLHDIGKLAVPEHIINKPGRLTAEEFDKMKIHPLVGSEILERVQFPYPVSPIVRSHHERWDGAGYPDGLKGEEIPIGARILSVVDCLDALSSDRQYRRALPLDLALQEIISQSGKQFDPAVVKILCRRFVQLEKLAQQEAGARKTSTSEGHQDLNHKATPAAGLAVNIAPAPTDHGFLSSIAAARQEGQTLFELSQDLGNSLSLNETLSLVALRLAKLIPYDSIAVYMLKDDLLTPAYVTGDGFRALSCLEIPIGHGISGWVAQNRRPIINGNPAVEACGRADASLNILKSGLAVPLEGLNGIIGVLTLYRAQSDGFTSDHLRILMAISSKVGLATENALKYEQAATSATTDYLTGLPNARSVFLDLDREVAQCKRTGAGLAIMVLDLDGFKQINDRYGHLEGNRVLQMFAGRLRDACRQYDYVARMGGDEFVIIAPGMDRASAESKAQVLDAIARETGRSICGYDELGLSMGAAVFPDDGTDAEALLATADRRMYVVKQCHHERPISVETALLHNVSRAVN